MDLIETSIEATAWVESALASRATEGVFGRFVSSVIWSNSKNADGSLLVPLDPVGFAAEINEHPFPLLLGHDPGRPLGKVLTAQVFSNADGVIFVAAVLGFYDGAPKLGFGDLNLDANAPAPSPSTLPDLAADLRFQIAADPREVDFELLNEIASDSPIQINIQERSNNAAEPSHSLIIVSALYATLVWNPFVTTFANEASKDAYAAVRNWLKKLSSRLAERNNPILEIQSSHGGCTVSFMLRGQDIELHHRAHASLDAAAASAAHLIARMQKIDLKPVRLVYEFHSTADFWHPSYAEISDGRLISDNVELFAIEKMPTGLSVSLGKKSLLNANPPKS